MDPAPGQDLWKCHEFFGLRVRRHDATDARCPGSRSMEMSRILRVEIAQTGCDGWTLPRVKIYGNVTYFDGRACAGRMQRMDPAPCRNLWKCDVFCGSRVRRQDATDGPCPGLKSMEVSRILGVESA